MKNKILKNTLIISIILIEIAIMIFCLIIGMLNLPVGLVIGGLSTFLSVLLIEKIKEMDMNIRNNKLKIIVGILLFVSIIIAIICKIVTNDPAFANTIYVVCTIFSIALYFEEKR